MRRAVTLSTLLLLPPLAGCDSSGTKVLPDVHTSPDEAADPRFADVLAYMQRQMAAGSVPGGSIAVVVDGKLAFQAGVGVERSGELTPVSSTTLFRAASLSKPVLAVAALRLVETGALDLSQPITTYMPSFRLQPPFDAGDISGQQLLDHTAGIPDFDVSRSCPVGPGAMEQWFLTAGRGELWPPPGEVYGYSNQGYALAGWMIESAAGMPYEDVVTSLVFRPAGMTTATFDPEVAMAEDHADGHAVQRGKLTISPPDAYDCEVTRPPGGVIATVVDYAHFAEMLLASGASGVSGVGASNRRVLQASSVLAMETGHADTEDLPDGGAQYGDGLVVYGDYAGQKVVSHTGLLDYGYQSSIWLVPSQGFAVHVSRRRGRLGAGRLDRSEHVAAVCRQLLRHVHSRGDLRRLRRRSALRLHPEPEHRRRAARPARRSHLPGAVDVLGGERHLLSGPLRTRAMVRHPRRRRQPGARVRRRVRRPVS